MRCDAIEVALTENYIVEETWELTNDLNDLYSKYFFATSLLVNLFILFITENPCFTDIYVIIVKLNAHCTMNTSNITHHAEETGQETWHLQQSNNISQTFISVKQIQIMSHNL